MSHPARSSAEWLWTCRPGFEDDLAEELGRARLEGVRRAGPALVASRGRPKTWPIFARTGLPVDAETSAAPDSVVLALAGALDAAFAGKPKGFLVATWVPDSDETNPLASKASSLEAATLARLEQLRPDLALRRFPGAAEARRYGGWFAQLALVGEDRVVTGVLPAAELPTLAPGGRARVGNARGAPSRAGRKLVEALDWVGRGPEPGEICVDLGAAPGGWSAVLLERRAKVIAVDPANLEPALRRNKGLTHVKASAFDFVPSERVDWLFCDMAWRPLEVAQLLAKWGRRGLAGQLVANIKLPMKQRVEFAERVIQTVSAGGWREVAGRQLYHDREEITLKAWRT